MIVKLRSSAFRYLGGRYTERGEPSAAQNRPWCRGRERAIVSPWFPLRTRDKVFALDSVDGLMRCYTDIVAGPAAPLAALADQISAGWPAPEVRIAVIVFLRAGQPDISEDDRDRLWRAFQAPVYQEYRGLQGRVLAWECEAQCGFHLAGSAWGAGIPGTLADQPCPCGLETPRLIYRPKTLAAPARALATTA